jgi:transcriptional regulator with XRE-family HTH domain
VADGPAAERDALGFGGLLRRLRDQAGLTQDELAEAAAVSQRAISDLERGINVTARKDTAVLLAGALGLGGPARELFVAAARGRAPAGEALAAAAGEAGTGSAAAASRTLPRDIAAFTGRAGELERLTAGLADAAPGGGVVGICAIGGMAGIGKTTLAVHAATRQARDQHAQALAIARDLGTPRTKHAPWKASAAATSRTATPAKAPPTCGRRWRSTSASDPPPPAASSTPSATITPGKPA